MATKLSGPGRLGSIKNVKKSLNAGASVVRTIPGNDSLTVRFLENPEEWHGYYEHWMKDGPRPCVADDCEGCESDDEKERKRNFRYLANAYVIDDQKVRPLQMPKTLVEQLVNFHKKYGGTLLDRDYELSKTGSGMNNTKYMAAPDEVTRMKLDRFEKDKFDLDEVLLNMLSDGGSDDDDDDDDEPVKKKGKKSKPKKSQKNPWDDDDDEPARPKKKKKSASVAKKRPTKKVAKRRTVRR